MEFCLPLFDPLIYFSHSDILVVFSLFFPLYFTEDAPSSSTTPSVWTVPRFLEVFTFKELTPGEWMSIKCTATGIPLPQITWSLDGFPLDNLDNLRTGDYVTNENYVISFVNISSVKPEHGGSYACKASSDAGSIENVATIRVLGDPFVRSMGNWTATGGTDVMIKCPVGGFPIEDIYWEKSEFASFSPVPVIVVR